MHHWLLGRFGTLTVGIVTYLLHVLGQIRTVHVVEHEVVDVEVDDHFDEYLVRLIIILILIATSDQNLLLLGRRVLTLQILLAVSTGPLLLNLYRPDMVVHGVFLALFVVDTVRFLTEERAIQLLEQEIDAEDAAVALVVHLFVGFVVELDFLSEVRLLLLRFFVFFV